MSSPSPEMGVTSEAMLQTPANLAAATVGELRAVAEDFTATVVEGYPAAWEALTQILGNAWPMRLKGSLDNGVRQVEVGWLFEESTDVDTTGLHSLLHPNIQRTYVGSTVPLPDTPQGIQLARAVNELAAPSIHRRWHNPEPILGVPGIMGEKGRTFSAPVLRSRVAEGLALLLTKVEVSDVPDSVYATQLEKEGLSHTARQRAAVWLKQLVLGDAGPGQDTARELMFLCEQAKDQGLTTPAAVIADVQQRHLALYVKEKQNLSNLVARLNHTTTMPVLTDAEITAQW